MEIRDIYFLFTNRIITNYLNKETKLRLNITLYEIYRVPDRSIYIILNKNSEILLWSECECWQSDLTLLKQYRYAHCLDFYWNDL